VNNRTFPHYGSSKSGWREWRNYSLSHVASSTIWLLHWILKNLIMLHLVTWLFWSKTLIGCLEYVKSASSGGTSDNSTSTGGFKHFFSWDTWKMSWTPTNDSGNSNLYTTVPHFSRRGMVWCNEVIASRSPQTSLHPSLLIPLGTHDL
jgi:hypothetical protein